MINIVSNSLQVVYPHVTSDSFQSSNKAQATQANAAVDSNTLIAYILS